MKRLFKTPLSFLKNALTMGLCIKVVRLKKLQILIYSPSLRLNQRRKSKIVRLTITYSHLFVAYQTVALHSLSIEYYLTACVLPNAPWSSINANTSAIDYLHVDGNLNEDYINTSVYSISKSIVLALNYFYGRLCYMISYSRCLTSIIRTPS